LQVGQPLTAGAVTAHLRKASYTESQEGRGVGSFTLTGKGLEIQPGPESFFRNGQMSEGPARLEFKNDRLVSKGGVHCGHGAVSPSSGRIGGHSFGAAGPTRDNAWGEGITSWGGRDCPAFRHAGTQRGPWPQPKDQVFIADC
jgi:hypothetical protein